MANGGRIEYSVGFKADSASLNNIKSSLKEIKDMSLEALNPRAADYSSHEQAFINLQESAGKLEAALDKAFNKDLGTLNIAKFNKELQKLDLHKIEKDMQAAGAAGVTAFRNIAAQALTTNMQLKQTHTFVDKIATTLSNTIKWNLASSAVNSFTGQVQQAYGYVKNLDSSLNDIRIVTGKANEEMAEFAKLANQTAQNLGKGTVDYTNAALIYYQQGLDEAEVQARAEVTLKAANVTGQSTDEVSEQLTAVWNGYKVSSQEAELYVDKLAAVAATTASDLEELSTGMSKVASAANTMGVDIDQLNAQLATIVSITRQAPESVGTALKTIYARMGDIEAGLDEETTLGNYTQAMADMGFNVLDMNGNLRDMGEVIEEIGGKWTTLSREQQVALSQTVAGTRQYNNLLALFDNWDMYTEALETSADAAGTLQEQQDIYMESTAAHLEKLDAKWEDFYDSILDSNTINKATDLLGGLVDGLTNVVDGLGGGIQTFELLGTVATSVLSKKISKGISTFISNIQTAKNNTAQFKAQLETIEIFKGADDKVISRMAEMREAAVKYSAIMDESQQNEVTFHIQNLNRLNQQKTEWEENRKSAEKYFKIIAGQDAESIDFNKAIQAKAQKDEEDSSSLKLVKKKTDQWKKEIEDSETYINEVEKTFKSVSNGVIRYTKDMDKNLDEFIEDLEKLPEKMEGLTSTIDSIVVRDIQLPEELGNAYEKYKNLINDNGYINFEDADARAAANNLIAAFKQALPGMKQEVKDFEDFIKQSSNGAGKAIEDNLQQAEKAHLDFIKAIKTQDGINSLINIANAANQIFQLFQTIKNIGNIWSDETISDGEKLEQTIGAIVGMTPVLISILPSLKTGMVMLAKSMGAAKTETMGLGAAFQFLKANLPLGWIAGLIIGVGALVIAINNASKAAEKAKKALENSRNEFKESTNQLKDLETELDNIKNKLEELIALENPTFTDKQEIKNLQIEQALLTAKLETQKAINEAKKQEYADKITQNREAGNYEVKDFEGKLWGQYGVNRNGDITTFRELYASALNPTERDKYYNSSAEDQVAFYEQMATMVDTITTLSYENPDEYLKLQTQIEDFKNKVAASSTLNDNSKNTILNILETRIIDALAVYEEGRKKALEDIDLDALLMDLEQAGTQANRDAIQAKIANAYRISGVAGKNVNLGLQNINTSQQQIDELKNAKSFEEVLSSEQLHKLTEYANGLGISIEQLFEDFQNNKNLITGFFSDAEIQVDNFTEQIISLQKELKTINEIISSLRAGKELTEEQLIEIQKLEKEYDGLSNILDKNSEAYIDALQQVQDLKEEEATVLANQKVAKLAEKIEVAADATEFYNAMDELVNAEYEALVTIKTDTKSDFDNAVNELEDMSNLISKIGEGFVVSAEDVSELTSVFPELLQNITYLEDGTVQLNKTSVEQAQKTAKAKIKLSTDEAIIEIEAQNKVLMAEKERYVKALEILQRAEEDGLTIKELSASDQFMVENALTKAQITNAEDVAEAKSLYSTQEQETFVKNNEEVLYETGKAVEEWAEKFNANVKYAYTGEETEGINRAFIKKKESVPIVSPFEADSHPIILNPIANANFDRFLDSSKPKNLEKQKENITLLESLIQSYNDAIDLNDSYIAELLARQNEQLNLFDNIGSGFGDDGNNAEIIDLLESEYDRYHDINIVLENISKTYSKLEKQQEKLTGKDLTNNLKVQLKVLEDQNKAYQEKLNIAKKHQAELQGQLDEYGATFDASGNLTNYETLYTNRLQEVIDSQKYYNSLNEYKQEGYKEKLEAQQESFERLEQLLSEYDDITYRTLVEIEEKTQETIDAITDAQISLFTFDIDFDIDEASFTKEFNEFKKNIIDDIAEENIFGQALAKSKNLDIYYNKNGGLVQGLTDQVLRTIQEIQEIQNVGASDVYGDNLAKAYEDLKKYNDQLMESLTDVKSTVDEIKQSYLDMMDQANEKFQEQIDMYDYIADVVNSDMSIVKLLYGEDSYNEFEKFYDILEENNKQSLDFQRQQTDFWKAQMDSAEEGSETWEKAKENWLSSVSALNTAIENSVELLIDKYSNTINKIFSDLNNKLTNGMGLEYIADEWELMNELSDQYLDNVNSGFEVRQLERKWIDSINDSALAAQSQLNALMNEQLAMLRAKDKLTQYDIDRANALYDIAVKQIALQEAQQNKSKMRLRRDSQGNYTYQYVSDEDAVAQAQQELDEAKNSMYNMDKDAYKDNLDAVYGYYEEFENKIKELYLDASLTEEEREAKKLQLIEYYEPLIQGKIQENNDIRQNLQDSAQEAMGMSLDEFLMNNLIPQWDSGLQQLTNKFAEEGGFIPSCSEAMIFLEDTTRDYQASLVELQEAAGTNFAGIISSQNEVLVNVQGLVAENDALIDKYGEELIAIGSVITQVGLLIDEYEDAYRAATDATTAAYKYWKAQQEGANIAAEIKDYFYGDEIRGDGKDKREFTWQQEGSNAALQSAQETLAAANEDLKAARKEIDDLNNKVGDLEQQLSSTKGELSTAKSRISLLESKLGIGQGLGDYSPKKLLPTANKNFTQAMMFDSGGYTGSWGDTGKLAILHEKELILNQQDTTNILNAVSVARTMANVLNSISSSVRSRVAGLSSSTSFDTSSVGGFGSEIQQSITIHADFPNATDHDEIQQAFNNLLNTASQYAFRNGRG